MADTFQLKVLRRENLPPVTFATVVLIAPGGQTFMFSVAVAIADADWEASALFPFRTRDEVRSVRVNHAKLRTFATHIEINIYRSLCPVFPAARVLHPVSSSPSIQQFSWSVHG
jgi:hypothetical protein